MAVTQRLTPPDQTGADWKEPLKLLLLTPKKQDGNMRTRWGPHSENVDNLELLIGLGVLSGATSLPELARFWHCHVTAQIYPQRRANSYLRPVCPLRTKEVIDASIVQLITVPTSQAAAIQSTIESCKSVTGWTGGTSGLSLAEVKGKGGKMCVAVVGWESLEAGQRS